VLLSETTPSLAAQSHPKMPVFPPQEGYASQACDLAGERIGTEASDLHSRLGCAYRDDTGQECWPDLDAGDVGQGYMTDDMAEY
jgi:hypothetical protein